MSSMQPLVSILLPAFNAAATLPACLCSIQRQSESRWECIIVDDGSADGTLQCARAFARHDERFVVLAAPHRGIVAALNAGLERCSGTFVARMDADDLMHRERLAAQLAALTETKWVAVGSHVRLFPRHRLADGRWQYERWLNSIDSPRRVCEEAFVECPIAHPTLMIRRQVLGSFGYDDARGPEDYDLILRVLAAGLQIGVVPRRLLCWRDHVTRLSRTSATYAIERFTACKAAYLATGFLAATEDYVLWGYGATARALRVALLAHGKRPAYIIEVHPGRIGNRIHGAPVVGFEVLPELRRYPVVVSVAGSAPRQRIRASLRGMGFAELTHFICAA